MEELERTDVESLLLDEIGEEFEDLKNLETGSEEYKVAVDGLTKLVDRAIEMEKFQIEIQEKAATREIENDLKLKQMEEERKDRLVKNIIAAAGITIPAGVTIWGALKSWEFEKEGTVTSTMGRLFMNMFRPKK